MKLKEIEPLTTIVVKSVQDFIDLLKYSDIKFPQHSILEIEGTIEALGEVYINHPSIVDGLNDDSYSDDEHYTHDTKINFKDLIISDDDMTAMELLEIIRMKSFMCTDYNGCIGCEWEHTICQGAQIEPAEFLEAAKRFRNKYMSNKEEPKSMPTWKWKVTYPSIKNPTYRDYKYFDSEDEAIHFCEESVNSQAEEFILERVCTIESTTK